MIPKDPELRFAAQVRQKIIDILAGIRDAQGYMFSDSSPNWLTSRKIQELIDYFETELQTLGAIRVIAHAPCGHRQHERFAVWKDGKSKGYWRYVFEDGSTDFDLLQNGELFLNGVVMETDFTSVKNCVTSSSKACPCNPRKRAEMHAIGAFYVWPRAFDSRLCELSKLIFVFQEAQDQANEHRPRSGIREQMWRALFTIEQLIVSETVDDHISRRNV
ncbi:hypothetical protein [Candidatus Halocynthiibacter alkanivorans]|uniref:hypothetical protein n=1 Tax=Candidatus Halocynthiibacter alkanivorans TaxID=2267619 RepID=UPI000DF1CACD|nr:hypothetical protein [Candidatus Halocynthiibacter alkanivorans]